MTSIKDYIEEIENKIFEIVLRQTINVPISQYKLYNELYNEMSEMYGLNSPFLKICDLRIITIIIMMYLPVLYDYIKTIEHINDTLSIVLLDEDNKEFDEKKYNEIDNTPKKYSMPIKRDVINYIIDNNIENNIIIYSISKMNQHINIDIHNTNNNVHENNNN